MVIAGAIYRGFDIHEEESYLERAPFSQSVSGLSDNAAFVCNDAVVKMLTQHRFIGASEGGSGFFVAF